MMKIELGNPKQMLSHVLLGSSELFELVADAGEDQGSPFEITATVSFNGVEYPAQILEDAMFDLFKQVERHYQEEYADIEAGIQKSAEKKVRDAIGDLPSKMRDLDMHLTDIISRIDY